MSATKTSIKKLALQTEILRVLTDAELAGVAGGFTASNWSMCVSNGEGNDCHSVVGECPTAPPRRRTQTQR